MNYQFLSVLALSAFLITGCGSVNTTKNDRHQIEISLHKVKTDVEDMKHDLNTHEIEYHIIEGKLLDQNKTLTTLKDQYSNIKSQSINHLIEEMKNLQGTIQYLQNKQENLIKDVRQLSTHSHQTTTALSQYKTKITELESTVSQINDIKSTINTEIQNLTNINHKKLYTIQSGDSLEKIARNHHVSVESIKTLNNMSSDLIVVDQQIRIP